MKLKIIFIFLIACLVNISIEHPVYSQGENWQVFSSRFCTVFYEEGIDLESINRCINLSFSDYYSPRRYSEKVEFAPEDILSQKFDTIFSKVEDILDMYPSKLHVTINIYKTKDGLDRAYEEIFNEPNIAISFYIYKTNTIYTTKDAINERILAHEMAHCIIDHYFVILPPMKVQEILAVYADVHLKD